jgi:hypothetical protein
MKPKVADKKPSKDSGGKGRSKPVASGSGTGDSGGKGRSKK